MKQGYLTNEEYDQMVAELAALPPRNWIKARSVEDALALKQWCEDNGIESPEVIVKEL